MQRSALTRLAETSGLVLWTTTEVLLNEHGPIAPIWLPCMLRRSLESDIDLLMCLVRAYVVARDTREVRPAHRYPDGDNRMPIYFAMFRTFAEAWAADNFHYTAEDLIADIAADERLLNWVRERGLQPEVPDHPATAQGEELVEAAITQDGDQEAIIWPHR